MDANSGFSDDRGDTPATPEWFVTFADMMTLLVALFVMLASFSEVREEERFRAISQSLRGQFGHAAASAAQDNMQARDPRLAAQMNAARVRRASLLGIDALPTTTERRTKGI